MVVTANPYASDVGANILRRGGTAADALVAVRLCLAWLNLRVREWVGVDF